MSKKQDKRLRTIKLLPSEIQSIIDELYHVPYDIFDFLRLDRLIKKLKDALEQEENKK